jgi:hypothetical protein
MATEQQTSPAGETCRCGRAMVNTTIYADEGMLRWRCPHCREIRHRPMPPDALAGALKVNEELMEATRFLCAALVDVRDNLVDYAETKAERLGAARQAYRRAMEALEEYDDDL